MNPFTGEIRIFAGNFAPTHWAFCSGQVLPISQNTALFSLLGTTYGGDGKTTFALPNLLSRAPLHAGGGTAGPGLTQRVLGESAGVATVTLQASEMPAHNHAPTGSTAPAIYPSPQANIWGMASARRGQESFTATNNPVAMSTAALNAAGGGLPHNNLPPYLGLTFIICLQGVFPQRPYP